MPALTVSDLTVEYRTGGYMVRPLDGFSMHAEPGSLVLLLGPSGSGKTTLLSCLAGILTPTAGSIRYGDQELVGLAGRELTTYRRHGVGVVFQVFNLVPSLTAAENVMVPLRSAGRGLSGARREAERLLGRVGLSDRLHHRPGDLSGGQQQRVAIARAIALDPQLVLADEPTAHLDHVQVEGVLRLLRGLTDDDRVVVVVTHDERIVPLADEVVELAPRMADAVAATEVRDLASGEVLFREGTRGDRIYVVEHGSIELVRAGAPGEELVAVAGTGQCFGEMGPLFQLPRSATARAREASRVAGYTVRGFRDRFGADTLHQLVSGIAPTADPRDKVV